MSQEHAAYSTLTELAPRYRAGEFGAAVYAARYLLRFQVLRRGAHSAQRRSRRDAKPDVASWLAALERLAPSETAPFLADLLQRYDLRGVRRRVNTALAQWLRGAWRLTLCEHLPTTREVLHMQVEGTRPVTVIGEFPRLLRPIEEKADAFAFLCHDLEHAWQFFHDDERHLAQRRFARELEAAFARGVFVPYAHDPVFARKLDYLAADMNTHVAHSLQYLRAILLEFLLRAEAKPPDGRLSPQARTRLHACLAGFSASVDFIPELAS